MGILEGKKAMIFGIANNRSIAWGIAQAFHEQGATLGISYAGEALERRVKPLAESLGCTFVEPCDVSQDNQIQRVTEKAAETFGVAFYEALIRGTSFGHSVLAARRKTFEQHDQNNTWGMYLCYGNPEYRLAGGH